MKETIKKLRSELAKTFAILKAEENEQNLGKVWAETEIKISEKAVGGKVELIQADGSLADAPDGEYEIEGGDKFKVEGGLIVEWNGEAKVEEEAKPAEAEEAMEEEVKPEEAAPAEDDKAAMQAEIDAMKTETESLKVAIAELKDMIAGMQSTKDEFSTQLDSIKTALETIAKLPAEFSKTNNKNEVKDSNEEKIKNVTSLWGKPK